MSYGAFKYTHLRNTIDNVLQSQSIISQKGDKWTIQNLLPTELVLYFEKYLSGTPQLLTIIKPHITLNFHPNKFGDRDQLYTYYRSKKTGKLVPFLEPYMFRELWKDVKLGSVEYISEDGHLQTQPAAGYADMRGVWLHNKVGVPLNVFYKGSLRAQISAYDGMNYLGGSSSSMYFDDDRNGLNFLDELTFGYSNTEEFGDKVLYTVTLDDVQCQSIYIGTVSGGERGPDPDTSVYNVDEPVWTGITYYKPIGGYETRATNPLAPF